MPSPIAHALAGIAAGWMIDPAAPHDRPAGRGARSHWCGAMTRAAAFAAAGMAADVDLLFGAHSGPTHGLGAALVAGAAVWGLCVVGRTKGAGRMATAIAVAYASHTLLDWLGSDSSPPIGVMALWPFSHDYYESRLHVFMAISRRYWLPEFWSGNLRALARELAILLPIATAVILLRRRRSRATDA